MAGVSPTRRQVAGGVLAGVAAAPSALAGPTAGRPNIVFILADDLGYADLSCYGRRDYRTPNIDSLAAAGLLMTQAYSNSAVCSATRMALITGRYQYRFRGGLEEPIARSGKTTGLSPAEPTLPSRLKRLGYRTSLVGKWHLGELPKFGPLKSGYDRFFGLQGGGLDYFRHRARLDGTAEPEDGLYEGERRVERSGYLTDLLGDRAVQEIESYARGRAPFLLSLHFNAPHWPWEGPDDAAVAATLTDLFHTDGGSLETYGKMVASLDENVGKVLRALERTGLADKTIVVFTSDNGGERYSDVWPLTGTKGELLEGGIRVPVLVRWPGVIAAGARSDQVMISMDWTPTLLAAAGRPSGREEFDGEDLLAALTGRAPAHPRKLYWRFKAAEQAAVRDGDWKYLKLRANEHLFDVVADPRERADLKARRPEVFARLKADFAAWNATMLAYPADSYSHELGEIFPDRY